MSSDEQRYGGLSGEAVDRATGRDWDAWLELLDGLGAREMDHKEIVALIAGPGALPSGWWQQMVAVGYGQARGLRVVGQTSAGGFQIGVQMTLPVSAGEAWDLLTEGPGLGVWLGTADGIDFRKGERYRTLEGASGEVRSVAPGERVRLTWSSPALAHPSTLQVTVMPSGGKASVRFHQERLSSLEERERMRAHWRDVLKELSQLATGRCRV
ncbi:MAG: SRPBCC domain-containing protein [Chloroflexi bacterium]|nr:SRPBCC domain-containing protein [Chloroflexota bacterium]MYB84642.1 SRPBCC domain-containing protein [Chloroflexota bacterium]